MCKKNVLIGELLVVLLLLGGAVAHAGSDKEEFETADFMNFSWEHAGDAIWTITSSEKYAGAYSAEAGEIHDGESTTLKVTLDCVAGDITFYCKVSSEGGWDYFKFYIDGVEKGEWSGEEDWAEMSFPVTAGIRTFEWTYSKDGAVSEGDDTAWIDDIVFPIAPELAGSPDPEDEETDVPRDDVVLSWNSGIYAQSHDVYFSTDEQAVIDGTAPVAHVTEANYGPLSLDLGTTYYWRVDEVNAPPDSTIFKGYVWSFTTEPFAIQIPAESIIAVTASSSTIDQGPENTVNGSGLDNDLHSTELIAMWLTAMGAPGPAWIQYEFDKVVKLHEMWVWNHNGMMEPALGLGIKEVTIEYSVNGTDYTALGATHEFARAPGTADYTPNTTVDFGGVAAKYVKLTVNSNWGGLLPQYGLSEVRFMAIPVFAREPSPDSGATDVDVDVTLGWRAGRDAATHDVYLSTDEQAVIDGNVPVATVTETSYSASIDIDSTYYWRIDEVNDAETPTTWKGEIWNLTTPEFLVVDDFELYNDLDNRISNTWKDGPENIVYYWHVNGSIVGYSDPPFTEQSIVHGGSQSMPLFYNNDKPWDFTYSEAALPLRPAQDWTEHGVTTLVLYFHGDLSNAVEEIYVKVNGNKVVYDGDPLDIIRPRWKQWNIDLASFGVDLSNVTELIIGIGAYSKIPSGATGVVFFDDIRLYKSAPAVASEEIWIEAEATTTIEAPMMIFDDPAASGGKYIMKDPDADESNSNPPDDGLFTYTFTVAGGTYKIAGRVISNGSNDSFWVQIPNATTQTDNHSSGWVRWNGMTQEDVWGWHDIWSSNDPGNPTVEFTMPAGTHTLEIRYREDETQLDALVITSID